MVATTASLETDWRQEWFEFDDATYLNLAGQSPLPRVSVRAVQAALEAKKFPHHKTDATYFEVPNRIRENISRLIGGKPEEIALSSGASAGAAAVAYALAWNPGDEVVVAKGEFPLQYTIWMPMEKREGLKVKIVAPKERFISADDLISAITRRTRVVSVSLVRYDDGSLLDALITTPSAVLDAGVQLSTVCSIPLPDQSCHRATMRLSMWTELPNG